MQKVTHPTATPDGEYTEGNPAQGQPATNITAEWLNTVQRELVSVVESAGLDLDPDDDGQVLQAVSALVGAGAASFKNSVINGAFDLWQRTSVSGVFGGATPRYVADRWKCFPDGPGGSGTAVVSRAPHVTGQTQVPGGPRYYLRWTQAQPASTEQPSLQTTIEDVRRFSARTVTLSFWIKADKTGNIAYSVIQQFGFGGSAEQVQQSGLVGFTPFWQRVTLEVLLDDISNATFGVGDGLRIEMRFPIAETYTMDIADVQLEPGNVPTSFERRPLPLEYLLAARYFQKSYDLETVPFSAVSFGAASRWSGNGPNLYPLQERLSVPMRTMPVVTVYDPETGQSGRVRRIENDTPYTVAAMIDASEFSTGWPLTTTSPPAGTYQWHWSAEAEF